MLSWQTHSAHISAVAVIPWAFLTPTPTPLSLHDLLAFFFSPAGIAMWQSQTWVSETEVEIVDEATVLFFFLPLWVLTGITGMDCHTQLPQANFLFLLPRYSTWWHGVLEMSGKAEELAFIQARKWMCMFVCLFFFSPGVGAEHKVEHLLDGFVSEEHCPRLK